MKIILNPVNTVETDWDSLQEVSLILLPDSNYNWTLEDFNNSFFQKELIESTDGMHQITVYDKKYIAKVKNNELQYIVDINPQVTSKGQLFSTLMREDLICTCCNAEIILEDNLCWDCIFWSRVQEDSKKNPRLIYKGTVFVDGGVALDEYSSFLGMGGACFRITMEDGYISYTNNLWCNGSPRNYYAEVFKDNCTLERVSREELLKHF